MSIRIESHVIIKYSAAPTSYPASVGIVQRLKGEDRAIVSVAPVGECLEIPLGFLEDLETMSAQRRAELVQQFRELSQMYRQLAESAETGGMLGQVQRALDGLGLAVRSGDLGKIVVETRQRVEGFQALVASHLAVAGLRMVGCRSQVIGGELEYLPVLMRLTFHVRPNRG